MTLALIIDDNRQTADALGSILKSLKIPHRAVYNPSSALTLLEEAIPDVILLDINMPGVNGFEVLGFLKREPRLEKIPVLIITSDDQPETSKKAIKAGAKAVLLKPVLPELLEQAFQSIGILE